MTFRCRAAAEDGENSRRQCSWHEHLLLSVHWRWWWLTLFIGAMSWLLTCSRFAQCHAISAYGRCVQSQMNLLFSAFIISQLDDIHRSISATHARNDTLRRLNPSGYRLWRLSLIGIYELGLKKKFLCFLLPSVPKKPASIKFLLDFRNILYLLLIFTVFFKKKCRFSMLTFQHKSTL